MNSFKTYFKKEMTESIRQNRYLILGVGFIFWAILNPLMLKLLPFILKGTVPEEVLGMITQISRLEAVQNYMKDVVSIGSLFIVFTLMGTLAEEIGSQKLVFPYALGVRPAGLVLAKTVHYILATAILILAGFAVNYYYISLFFSGEEIAFTTILLSAALFMLYFAFNISLLIAVSSLVKKPIVAGISVLLFIFASSSLQQIALIREYVPSYLITRANQVGSVFDGSQTPALLITLLGIIFFNLLAIWRMKRVEVV